MTGGSEELEEFTTSGLSSAVGRRLTCCGGLARCLSVSLGLCRRRKRLPLAMAGRGLQVDLYQIRGELRLALHAAMPSHAGSILG